MSDGSTFYGEQANGSGPYFANTGLDGAVVTRQPRMITGLGDSRVAAFFLDATSLVYGAMSPVNWANALLNQTFIINKSFGKSGDRTDHMLARLPAALATNAGILYVQGGVNNIAQTTTNFTYIHAVTKEVVTHETVARVVFEDLKQICDAAIAKGMKVILENEVGANVNDPLKIAATLRLRERITSYGEITKHLYVHDAFDIINNPAFSATQIGQYVDRTYDGTHVNARGAYRWGKSLATILRQINPIWQANQSANLLFNSNAALHRNQLLANANFLSATGGTLDAAFTGAMPSGWTLGKIGTPTGSATVVADPNGNGNILNIKATFTANGQAVRLTQALSGNGAGAWNAALVSQDILQSVVGIDIVSAVGVASLYNKLTINSGTGGTNQDNMSMFGPATANYLGVNEACSLTLATKPVVLPTPAGPFPFVVYEIQCLASGAGSVEFNVKLPSIRRRHTTFN